MPTPPNIDDLPDGPTDNYKQPKKRVDDGDDIYEQPTLRLKEKPAQDKIIERNNNMRES